MTKESVRSIGITAAFLASGLALAACGDSSTDPAEGTAYFTAALSGDGSVAAASATAADEHNGCPVDGIAAAEIDISSIYFQGVPDGGSLEVWSAEDNGEGDGVLTVDLCALAAGQTEELTDEPVEGPSGDYGQLRLVAEEGRVWLDGNGENDEPEELQLPSAAQSGIKILPPRDNDEENDEEVAVVAEDGETVHLDIAVEDIEGNFVFQGQQGVLFTPVLRLRE